MNIGSRDNFDKVILKIYGNKFKGSYVEVGGHHPLIQSNSYILDKSGWSGIVIEPQTVFNDLYKEHRSCILENIALVSFDCNKTKIDFIIDEDCNSKTSCVSNDGKHLWRKHINGYHIEQVPCCTLQFILDKHKMHYINVMSIDVESYELNVLNGIDFNKSYFDIISLEHFNSAFESFFKSKSYKKHEELGKKTNSSFYVNQKSPIHKQIFI
jgi:FkbM family methyltransferase